KLQEQRTGFCRVGNRTAYLASMKIDIDVGEPSRRIEDRKQSVAQLFSRTQQPLIDSHFVAGEQTTKETDRYFEVLDVNIAVEGEIAGDKLQIFRRFAIEMHQKKRVECVNRCHLQRLPIPIASGLAQRTQRIVSPGILLVITPGVQKLGSDLSGDFPIVAIGVCVACRYG